MFSIRWLAVVFTALVLVAVPSAAQADVPVGPARLVECPRPTDDSDLYRGPLLPYGCHSAVADPVGRTVVLRLGRSDASGPSAFGMLHALLDHNVEDHVIERVVSSALPISGPRGRVRYIAEFRRDGHGVMSVWVDVDPRPSRDAPDPVAFGVLTAYCKLPAKADPENKCPQWVNDTL